VSVEAGAGRLFALVSDACSGTEDLPARLEAGLRAALAMLAADPDLAGLLTVPPFPSRGQEESVRADQSWIERFGELLSEAAASDQRTTTSDLPLLAPFLIGAVRFEIGRQVLAGEAADLPNLLPGLLEVLLAFYFEPGEARLLARAALAARDDPGAVPLRTPR
jgi:hypothetical protein